MPEIRCDKCGRTSYSVPDKDGCSYCKDYRPQIPSRQELERKVFLQHGQLQKLNTIVDGLEKANGHLLAEIAELRKGTP